MRAIAITSILALATVGTAWAQSSDDWDLTRSQDGRVVEALLGFSSGLTLAARCEAGVLTASIDGLEADKGLVRTITVEAAGRKLQTSWVGGEGRTAVADYPAAAARHWRPGGDAVLTVLSGRGETRYRVPLPRESRALAAVLDACKQPHQDARDADLPIIAANGMSWNASWLTRPEALHPEGDTYVNGLAVVSCESKGSGDLQQCRVESESPADGNFGRAALASAREARAAVRSGAPQVVAMRIVYSLPQT